MKRSIYLILITIIAVCITACGGKSNKELSCTHILEDEDNHKKITTTVKTTFDHEEQTAIKMTSEIETILDKEHYNEDEGNAYNEAYKADEVCANLENKLVTQKDKAFECDTDYQDRKILTTYTYHLNKLDLEDQEVLLYDTKTMTELNQLFNDLGYTCN